MTVNLSYDQFRSRYDLFICDLFFSEAALTFDLIQSPIQHSHHLVHLHIVWRTLALHVDDADQEERRNQPVTLHFGGRQRSSKRS